MAGCVLVLLYVLIIFEVVHRTLAAMIGATAAIACLTIIHDVSFYGRSNCRHVSKIAIFRDLLWIKLSHGWIQRH